MGKNAKPDLDALEPNEWAYIAGFFDGEGCVQIVTSHGTRPYLEITVGQSKEDVLYWMEEAIGGTVSFVPAEKLTRRKGGGLRRPRWTWRTGGQWALEVLRRMQPYIRVKVGEVEAGIEFQEKNTPYKRLTAVELVELQKIARGLKQLRACNV